MSATRSPGFRVERIRSHHTFELFRTSGVSGRSGPVRIKFVQQSSWSKPQVAYALGKKLGGAVVRNHLRRRLREIVTPLASELPPGAYLISAGPGATELTFDELRMATGQALQAVAGRQLFEPIEK